MRRAVAVLLAAACVAVGLGEQSAPRAQAAVAAPLAWEHALAGRIHLSAPTIADVNGDGQNEIVVGDLAGLVHVFKGDGSGELPGWPQAARPDGVHATAVESAPAVADLDGDHKMEIIVGATSTWVPNQQGGLVVFDASGHTRWHWQGIDYSTIWNGNTWRHDGYTEGAAATPAIGDVDGDGHPDIVFGTFEAKIHALDRNGRELPGFPYQPDDAVWSSAALYDIDGDGRMEIFVGSGSTGGGPDPHMGGTMFALDWRGGQVVTLWRRNLAESLDASPAMADVNGDGHIDVVSTTSWYFINRDSRSIFAWDARSGTPLAGFPVDTGAITVGSPAVGDLNGDHHPDIVVGSWDGHARAYDGHGHKLWDVNPFVGTGLPTQKIEGAPVIADVDGNGTFDVVMPTNMGAYVLDGRTGQRLAGPLDVQWSMQNSPAVGVLAGQYRLVLSGFQYGYPYAESDPRAVGHVFVHDLVSPTAATSAAAWPVWRANAVRLGAPPSGGHPWPPYQCTRATNPVSHPDPAAAGRGYRVVYRNATVRSFGTVPKLTFLTHKPASGIVASAGTADGKGVWLATAGGVVYAFGTAHAYGKMPHLASPLTALAATPSGHGYWVAVADGGVYGFGDAHFYGSAYGKAKTPIVAITPTPSGHGYWMLSADGGVYGFGSAHFHGSAFGKLHGPARAIASSPSGVGYWIEGSDGSVLPFGDALFHGSANRLGLCRAPATVALARSFDAKGYTTLTAAGQVYAFGDAARFGVITTSAANPAVAVLPVR